MIYEDVLKSPGNFDFSVPTLGACAIDSPVKGRTFVEDDEKITFASQVKNIDSFMKKKEVFPAFQKGGPRQKIYFNPEKTRVGIITCGGLCPGLNNVIKGLVTVLYHEYGVKSVTGFRYGYQGLLPSNQHPPITLTPQMVDTIHKSGGTILGSSRESQDCREIVDNLQSLNLDLLFCIGGDGTIRCADAIADELKKRKMPISIIGIPKTIDNDVRFVEKTFGFETAVHVASEIITSAHNEAEGADNGISILKLMGRDSGFIAAAATLANSVVDFCLVPEIEFVLEGKNGLLQALKKRLSLAQHAVIVVAEGAGQNLFKVPKKTTSWNAPKNDIGTLLKDEIGTYFQKLNLETTIKYLDPSYHIRSVAAIPSDAVFCHLLAEHAVHAGMAGKTGIVIGQWNNYFTHVPMKLASKNRRVIDLEGAMWKGVLSSTRQNDYFG